MNRKRKAPESGLLMRFIGIRLSDLHFFERQRLSSNTICCGKVLHLTRLVDAEQTEGLLVFSSFGIGIPGALPSAAPASLDPFPMIWRFNKNGKECLLRLAEERYTTKHYNGKMIPREQFATLCEILRLAPTSVNAQAWHFFTAHTAEARAKLLPALPDFNHDRVTGASDVVVFTVPTKLTDAHFERVLEKEAADGRFPNDEIRKQQDQGRRYFAGLHMGSEKDLVEWEARQAYIGMGIMLYAAAGMGIDSTCLEGVDFKKVDEILGLREKGLTAVVLLSLGYRNPNDGNAMRPKSRLTTEELFTEIK